MGQPGILLIEDEDDDTAMMVRILRKYRISNRVETVHDGEEALKLLLKESAAQPPSGDLALPGRFVPELVLLGLKHAEEMNREGEAK